MTMQPPEIAFVASPHVSCDGAENIKGGAALGHPRVWLEIDERGFAECGYCDRRFVLKGGPADIGASTGASYGA
jgi:NADH dehydrogenase (ubiquinone) Fe-S protein 6